MSGERVVSYRKMTSSSEADDNSGQEILYKVEKVLKKRVVNGKEQYFVKWLGYPSHENTWKDIECFANCMELITQFEEQLKAKKGQRKTSSEDEDKENIRKDGNDPVIDIVMEDLEINFEEDEEEGDGEIRTQFESGLIAERIIGATMRSGELCFVIKWANLDEADVVFAKDANVKWPQVVIAFYERNLQWNQ